MNNRDKRDVSRPGHDRHDISGTVTNVTSPYGGVTDVTPKGRTAALRSEDAFAPTRKGAQ